MCSSIEDQADAVLRVFGCKEIHNKHYQTNRSEATTAAAALATCRVRWSWCDVLDSANLHTGSSESSESGLCAWARCLCAVA